MNSKPEPITYSGSEYLNLTKNPVEAKQDLKEAGTKGSKRKARQAAVTIGLAVSMGAVGIVVEQDERAIAAEAITSKLTFTNLSQNNKGTNSSLTPEKLTVKSSANQINSTAPTAPVLIHKTQPKETIVSISAEYDIDPKAIAAYNNLAINRERKPGKLVKIPVNRGIVSHSNPEGSSRAKDLEQLKNKQKRLQKSLSELQLPQSEKKSHQPILLTRAEPKNSENSSNRIEAAKEQIIYKVQQGDTLGGIAIRYGVSITQLVRENQITDPNSIAIDRELVITLKGWNSQESARNRDLLTRGTISEQEHILYKATSDLDSDRDNQSLIPNQVDLQQERTETNRVNPYIEKLRADIQRLRQGYKTREINKQLKVSSNLNQTRSNNPVSVSERFSDPEWLKKRLQRVNSKDTTSAVSPQTQNQKTVRQFPSIDSLSNSRTSAIAKPEPQLVNSSDGDRVNFKDSLKVSLAERVSPELPPLPTAEQYLPTSVDTTNVAATFASYRWPAKGIVTSGFGWRWGRLHKGVDIAGPVGTPIFAAAPGKVISAGWNSGGYGNLVKIRHYDGSTTLYAHNSSIVVRRGQSVGQGQMIARMGSTGYSTGPHLHFEIHKAHRGAVNPMAYLPRKR